MENEDKMQAPFFGVEPTTYSLPRPLENQRFSRSPSVPDVEATIPLSHIAYGGLTVSLISSDLYCPMTMSARTKYAMPIRGGSGTSTELLLLDFLKDVLEGKKGNYALHTIFKRSPMAPDGRGLFARTCQGTLRSFELISSEISSRDPAQVAAAGMFLFTDRFPSDLGLEKRRMDAIKMRVGSSDPLSRVLKANSSEQVPQKAALASAPDWLKDILSSSLGEDFRGVLADSLLPPKYLVARANSLLTDREGSLKELMDARVWAEASELDPDAILLLDGTSVDSLQAYREGRLEVQDLSSQLVCRLAVKGMTTGKVIDACAGNGGKTLALSAMMGNKGNLVSMDNNERSLSRLRQRARRAQVWNYQRVHVKGDAELEPYKDWADVVLVDAPCSGLGTLRRNPDIKLHLDREQVSKFPMIQLDLLRTYSNLVRPGGRLIYSTCTLNRSENEGVVNSFLSEAKGFELKDAHDLMPDLPKDLFRGPFFQILPADDRSGFYAAFMIKSKDTVS